MIGALAARNNLRVKNARQPVCMRCRITQFARERVGLCPFRGSYVREFELSHSNPVNRGAQLFEGLLALNPGFSFLCSKAFSRIIFSVIFRASNHQLVDKKN